MPRADDSGSGRCAIDIDTRTDIYSLGVILYELLVGALPFDPRSLREAGYMEMQRIIREVDPPRPSTRLSTLAEEDSDIAARHRQSDRSALARRRMWIRGPTATNLPSTR